MKFAAATLIRLAAFALFLYPSQGTAQNTTLPLTGVWNGFLLQENVVECANLSDSSASLTLTITDYQGSVLGVIPFTLESKATTHIPLNPYNIQDSYGTFAIEAADNQQNFELSCLSAFYRLSGSSAPKPVEYAYALPMLDALSGPSTGVFNTFDPAMEQQPVLNYLTIYNPGVENLSALVEIYSSDGTLDNERSFRIESLPPAGRKDTALGYGQGEVVGLYRVVPDDDSLPYGAFVTRFRSSPTGGYTFAFPLLSLKGSCSPGPVPASTMDPATNWGEVANITGSPVEARIQIRDRFGALLLDETRTIAPYAQHHTHINTYLGERNVGTFSVECSDGSVSDALLVQSLYYGRFNDLSPQLEWAYASQAMGQLTSENKGVASHVNTFLGASNWNKLLDAGTSTATEIDLNIYDSGGTLSHHQEYTVAASGSVDAGLHEPVGDSFVGLGIFTPRTTATLYPELLRVFPHQHTSIGYVMRIPNIITASSPITERQRVLDDYDANYLGSAVSSTGWTGSTQSCSAGTVPEEVHTKTLQRINYFRRTAGLPDDITFDPIKNAKCQQAALMMDANNSLSHSPPDDWDCYTADGDEAAGKSNLGLGLHSTRAISAYMADWGSSNTAVGHRRWILYSRAYVMGHGTTSSANALWVIGGTRPTTPALPEFISWPPENYIPSPLVYGRWSFGVPSASFANATVSMLDSDNNPVTLEVLPIRNGYGDNTIVWEPEGIDTSSSTDVTYTVNIQNVVVNEETKNYSYNVIIIQP